MQDINLGVEKHSLVLKYHLLHPEKAMRSGLQDLHFAHVQILTTIPLMLTRHGDYPEHQTADLTQSLAATKDSPVIEVLLLVDLNDENANSQHKRRLRFERS